MTDPELPENVGVLFVPAAVTVWVCVDSADPVKVCAGTVNGEPGLTPPIVLNAPALEPALLAVAVATDDVLLVPAGVPAEVAPDVT
jgi:hypothetical protein